MPRRERIKLFADELELLRSVRRSRSLAIPDDNLFRKRIRAKTSRLVGMGGFDHRNVEHLYLVCAIAYGHLFESRPPGRRTKFTDKDDYDLLTAFLSRKVKATGLPATQGLTSVAIALSMFDERFTEYKSKVGPHKLKKRFERARKRLSDNKMTALDAGRLRVRKSLLLKLDHRFGRPEVGKRD
jgi:hypothetical protein